MLGTISETIQSFPALKPLRSSISVRSRCLKTVDYRDFVWLDCLDSKFVGLDTKFDNLNVSLIQIASDSKCLLISVSPLDRKSRIINLHLAKFLESNIIKVGAELTYDAILIAKDLGIKMAFGYDLTPIYNSAKSIGLFEMFSELHPDIKLLKDKHLQTSTWDTNGVYTADQIKYAVLDALISFHVGVAMRDKLANIIPFSLSNCSELQLMSVIAAMVTQRRIADLEEEYESDINKAILNKSRMDHVIINMARYKTRIRSKSTLVVTISYNGIKKNLEGRVGQVKGTRADVFLNEIQKPGTIVTKIVVSEDSRDCPALKKLSREIVTTGNNFLCYAEALMYGVETGYSFTKIPPIKTLSKLENRKRQLVSNLDDFQNIAVNAIVNDRKPFSFIHGPPGNFNLTKEPVKLVLLRMQ